MRSFRLHVLTLAIGLCAVAGASAQVVVTNPSMSDGSGNSGNGLANARAAGIPLPPAVQNAEQVGPGGDVQTTVASAAPAGGPIYTQAQGPTDGLGVAPTADEQGFGEQQRLDEARRALEDAAAFDNPRQRGEQVRAPSEANPVSRNAQLRGWLSNWEYSLSKSGVASQKVRFEASRLNQADFEQWASRQMRYRYKEPQIIHAPIADAPAAVEVSVPQGCTDVALCR